MEVYGGRMCDIDGCSSTDNLTNYENDVDLCEHHTYLAPKDARRKMTNLIPTLKEYEQMGFKTKEEIYDSLETHYKNARAVIKMLEKDNAKLHQQVTNFFVKHEDFVLELCKILKLDYVLAETKDILEAVRKLKEKNES